MTSYHGWTHAPKARGGTDPIDHSCPIEWVRLTSSTDWTDATDWTTLDFTIDDQDSDVATFDLSAGSNLLIGKHGVYDFRVYYRNYSNSNNVTTSRTFEVKSIAGETPTSLWAGLNWDSPGHSAWWASRITDAQAGGIIDVSQHLVPVMSDYMHFDADTFGSGTAGPSEIQVRAYKDEDGTVVSESSIIVGIAAVRVGDAYS